jgi:hypothetical protein
MLPERWKKCLDSGGEYVEDWHVQVSVAITVFKKKNQSRSYLNHLVLILLPPPVTAVVVIINSPL